MPPLESELPPVDIPAQQLSQGQQNARSYLLNIKRADGTPVYTEQQLATWKPETIENVAGELQTYRNTFDDIMRTARDKGVPTAIYYPKPLHQQTAYENFPAAAAGLPVSERVAQEVFSLPMHAYLDQETQDFIIDSVRSVLQRV